MRAKSRDIFLSVLKRDLWIAFRERGSIFNLLMLLVITICLFPLSMDPNANYFHEIGVGIIWVMVLIISTLALPRWFEEDFRDGSLELFLLPHVPLLPVIFAKLLGHWLSNCLPVILLMPLLAYFLGIAENAILKFFIILMLGSVAMALINLMGASLTLGSRKGSAVQALLVLPLHIPILIFATGGLMSNAHHSLTNLTALVALLLIIFPLSLVGSILALRAAGGD